MCDGESVVTGLQEEAKQGRTEHTKMGTLRNSRAKGCAQRAVQAIVKHVLELRRSLELRLGGKVSGKHSVRKVHERG